MKEKIKLKKTNWYNEYTEPKTGITWIKFSINCFDLDQERICYICKKRILDLGFLSLNSDKEVCYDCVEII